MADSPLLLVLLVCSLIPGSWGAPKRLPPPKFKPFGGTFIDSVDIDLYSDHKADPTIYYTLDGSKPTNESTVFSETIHLSTYGRTIVRARSEAKDHEPGEFQVAFVVQARTAAPVFSPEGGRFMDIVEFALTTITPGAQVYYTTDGTAPDAEKGEKLKGHGIAWSKIGTTTFKAIAVHENQAPSAMTQAKFIVYRRPPRPAFQQRDKAAMQTDIHAAFHKILDKADSKEEEVLYPRHLMDVVLHALNPDHGRCRQCVISPQEESVIRSKLLPVIEEQGLMHSDVRLHHGFLSRGACLRAITAINRHLHRYRLGKEEL